MCCIQKHKIGIGLLSVLVSVLVFTFLGASRAEANFSRSRRSTDEQHDSSKLQFEPGSLHTTSHVSTSIKSLLQKASQSIEQTENELSTDDVEMTTSEETLTSTYSTTTSESEEDKIEDSYGAEQSVNSFVHEMMIQSARRPNDDFELPDFEICPILPDLPGESGSIRKVRDTERAKVERRIEERLKIYQNRTDCVYDCHVGCPEGWFKLPGMTECRPRLNCAQIKKQLPTKDRYLIGGGGVKRIYTAQLNGSAVVIARVKRFKFNQYLESMIDLQQTGVVAQLIGVCEEPAWPEVVLQYHSLGSLLSVSQLPNDLDLRWRVVMSYLDVVNKLHTQVPRSPRVLCDASRTEITLSQFLLTDDFQVVLNDVDELIAASQDGTVRCNCNIIRGGSEIEENMGCLVPPEQKQCGLGIFYTEKIDIWKIPDITKAILGESEEATDVWNKLYRIHQECKLDEPLARPEIGIVVDKYLEVQQQFNINPGL